MIRNVQERSQPTKPMKNDQKQTNQSKCDQKPSEGYRFQRMDVTLLYVLFLQWTVIWYNLESDSPSPTHTCPHKAVLLITMRILYDCRFSDK